MLVGADIVLLFVRLLLSATLFYGGFKKAKELKNSLETGKDTESEVKRITDGFIGVVKLGAGAAMLTGFFTEYATAAIILGAVSEIALKFKKRDLHFEELSYELFIIALALTIFSFGSGVFAFSFT